MSKSLLFECDPVDQPAATDPVERETWCALGIRVDRRIVSTIWDKSLQSERTRLYLPAFPIAEWLVQNWWSLLNELCCSETVPKSAIGAKQVKWIRRHCLRSADSALMLPALYLFHDGQSLRAEWYSDPPRSIPNMPGEFIADGADELDTNATQESLTQFIHSVLGRVTHVDDERVRELSTQWRAIQGADAEEQQFCTLAGRMGLDPYDRSEMTEELACFLEQTLTSPEDALVRDLTELAQPDSIQQQWQWLTGVSRDLQLGPIPFTASLDIPSRALAPPQFGYQLARNVREAANIRPGQRLVSVEEVATSVIGEPFRVHERNHIPGQGIRAIVGRSSDGDVVTVGPQPLHPNSQRFLTARSVYHALLTSQNSQRLVTTAHSWDQKAARAFAAELIAPQQALATRIRTSAADEQTIEELSREFNVSTMVIEWQLVNAGIPLSVE